MNAQSTIQLDLASVPREIRNDLARPLALAVDAYFKQPGVEEKFQQCCVGVTTADSDFACPKFFYENVVHISIFIEKWG